MTTTNREIELISIAQEFMEDGDCLILNSEFNDIPTNAISEMIEHEIIGEITLGKEKKYIANPFCVGASSMDDTLFTLFESTKWFGDGVVKHDL